MELKLPLVLIRNFILIIHILYRNGYYGSKCNNDDFFVVATCMDFDLKGLKKLCLNSLECSLLDESEKKAAIEFWNKKWIGYIAYINKLTI